MDLTVSREALAAMQRAAADAHPDEACGVLLGERDHVTEARSCANVHEAPRDRFEIDPKALIDAHRAARAGGPQVLGYFHSHPRGRAIPSATDAAMAANDGAIWAILDSAGSARFFRDTDQGFRALSYLLEPG
ncbi:M67 family metallopeptidase [Qipengyuania nanhaisediminis]|uniref:M67 family metallopeptidase n=1 Tax=Qipengyuania nanhaisediminis TaxID=604088 RepID=UPI0038B236B0